VARLLEVARAEPDRILVCTFTRTAVGDLVKALRELGLKGANKVVAGTIHSFCFRLLSRKAVLESTGRVSRPLLRCEERFMQEDLARCGQGGLRELGRRLKAFNAAWARLQSDQPGWPRDPVDRSFQINLLDWLRFHQAMLIGELVPQALRYLRENPACEERYLFDHTLIDEYQDLNRSEQELLDLLAGAGTLTIVGDEDQSIYSFLKYAHPEGITGFPRSHPGAEDVPLQECRRCPGRVVELANNLIAHNR
jgi:superfamily I DNA/RNA helicase